MTDGTIFGNTIEVTFTPTEGSSPRGPFTCVGVITGSGSNQRIIGDDAGNPQRRFTSSSSFVCGGPSCTGTFVMMP